MVPVAALPAVSTPSQIFDPTQRLTRCPTRVTRSGVNAESICLPSCPGSIPGSLGLTGAALESAGPPAKPGLVPAANLQRVTPSSPAGISPRALIRARPRGDSCVTVQQPPGFTCHPRDASCLFEALCPLMLLL